MIRFEDRLSKTVASVMGLALLSGPGCLTGVGTADDDTGTDTDVSENLEGMCSGEPAPNANYFIREGFVEVAPGAECPDAATVALKLHGCDFDEWQDITCDFQRVDRDQVLVDNGYGGYFADAATAPGDTGMYAVGPLTDVCYYEGVFWDDPDVSTTCGRPLLRDGEAVIAPVTGRPDWTAAAHPVVVDLTAEERKAASEYWLECAVLEHASVASFAHFSMDLLRLGAPPSLLRDAHQAGLDEIEHARLCFALASGYAGKPLGPGPLDVHGPANKSMVDIAEALFREGCVGETLAAVDAAARLAVARDGAVREALTVILRDESAHAALAWRALRWILQSDVDGAVRTRLEAVFAEEAARWSAPVDASTLSPALGAHGLIGESARARELRRAWDDVIAPSWAALS